MKDILTQPCEGWSLLMILVIGNRAQLTTNQIAPYFPPTLLASKRTSNFPLMFFWHKFWKMLHSLYSCNIFRIPYKIEENMLKKININDVYCLFLCHFNVLKTHTRTQPHEVKYQGGSRSFARKPTKQKHVEVTNFLTKI